MLMMDIKIITTFSILFVSLMVSNEFLEFLANIIYTAILFIVILFFYQNRKHFINHNNSNSNEEIGKTSNKSDNGNGIKEEKRLSPENIKFITKEITIDKSDHDREPVITTTVTKEQSPGAVRLISNYSKDDNDQQMLINQYKVKNTELSDQLNKAIEKMKHDQLINFNTSNKQIAELKESKDRNCKLQDKHDDLLNSIIILNSTIDQSRLKLLEITKDRDQLYSSDQKQSSKITSLEKRIQELIDSEKQLNKKLNDQKDQYQSLKKEFDDKVKKQIKLEQQISKIQLKQEQKAKEKEKERDRQSGADLSILSPSKSIPIPGSGSIITRSSSGDNLSSAHSISPSGSLRESSDGDSDSGSQSGSSELKFKSLFNKVKTEFYSSKIVNKAQKGINKHLGSDFFNTPNGSANTSSTSISSTTTTITTNTTSTSEQQLEIIQDKTTNDSPIPIKPLIFFEDLGAGDDKLTDSQEDIKPMTISPRGDRNNNNNNQNNNQFQKEQSLSDLFLNSKNSSNNISLSTLDDLIIKNSNSNENIVGEGEGVDIDDTFLVGDTHQVVPSTPVVVDQVDDCKTIQEYSIKEEENKVGLRRAKKKPSPGSTTMMEDVSIGIYPFLGNESIALFGVFDGHAGRQAADSAARLVPDEIEKVLATQDYNLEDDQSQLFKKVFENVDNRMKQDHEYEGCTATVSLIWKSFDNQRYLQVGNVGDSSAFLCRNNQSVELTFDHKANDPSEKQRMKDSGIPISDNQTRINGVAVSRSLGNHFIKDQNIGMISIPHISNCYLLSPQDKFIVLASDGLWDIINGQMAIDKVLPLYESGASASTMASLLMETAVSSSMCKDNVTVIIVKL